MKIELKRHMVTAIWQISIFSTRLLIAMLFFGQSVNAYAARPYNQAQCQALQSEHPDIDLSSEFPNIHDQTDIGFCYAYAGADFLSYHLRKSGQLAKNENISALQLALSNNEIEREENYKKFELYYGPSVRELQTKLRQLDAAGKKGTEEWREILSYRSSLMKIAGPLLVEPTGEYIPTFINHALESGYCLENEVPSSYITSDTNSKNKKNQPTYLQLKSALFEIGRWPLADSELANEAPLNNAQTLFPLLSREQIQAAYTTSYGQTAPLTMLNSIACQKRTIQRPEQFKMRTVDRLSIIQAIANKNMKYTEQINNKVVEKQNSFAPFYRPSFEELSGTPMRRLHLQYIVETEDPYITYNWPLLQEVDSALNNKQPIIVAVKADFLNFDTPENLRGRHHAVLIVGRQLNCKTGQFEYLIRNSWGPQNCALSKTNYIKANPSKSAPYRCEKNGYIWLNEDLLHVKINSITTLDSNLKTIRPRPYVKSVKSTAVRTAGTQK